MKTIAILITSMIGLASFNLMAQETSLRKAPLDVNFNSMIDATQAQKKSLAEAMGSRTPNQSEEVFADQKRVVDLLDVEIGVGEAPQLVDRRYK